MSGKVKVGDKVTLSDGMYDKARWRHSWVTEAHGVVGFVVSIGLHNFSVKWVGINDNSAPNNAGWVDDWVKVLGSTTE